MILSIHDWLKLYGITKGNCVAVQAIHEDICIACFYAVHLVGAILIPLEKSASQERIREIAEETGAALIISSQNSEAACRWVDYSMVSLNSHLSLANGCCGMTLKKNGLSAT